MTTNTVKKPPKLLGLIALGIMFTAPLWSNTTAKTPLTKTSSGVLNNTEFTINVTDKQVSNSGLVYCKFSVPSIEKVFVGSCNTADNKTSFKIGWNYIVAKSQIKDNNIIIYKTAEINSVAQLTVVRITHRAGTKVAVLSDGSIVGGSNLSVGDFVNIH
jgi:hypothetical protein